MPALQSVPPIAIMSCGFSAPHQVTGPRLKKKARKKGFCKMSDALTYHSRFTPEEFDAQYNLRAGRPDYEVTVIPDWIEHSKKAQQELDCILDRRYGDGEKQNLDIYPCAGKNAPVLIYFHGGYWQRGDKSIYGFLAEPFVKAGIHVVVAGYDLCPTVSITTISAQARAAVHHIWKHGIST